MNSNEWNQNGMEPAAAQPDLPAEPVTAAPEAPAVPEAPAAPADPTPMTAVPPAYETAAAPGYPIQPPAGTYPAQPPAGTYPAQPPAGTYPTQPPAGTYPAQPPAGTYPAQPPAGAYPAQPPAGTYPVQPPAGTYPVQPPAGTYPVQPPVAVPVARSAAPQTKSRGLLAFFLILLAVVVVGVGMTAVYYLGRQSDPSRPSAEETPSFVSSVEVQVQERPAPTDGENADGTYRVNTVVDKLKNSVVSITIYAPDGSSGASASGMILSEDGLILTNDHIYRDVPNAKFMITMNDGAEYPATFVAGDSRSDIALLQMTGASGLQPVIFGKSSQCIVGEQVVAIGNSAGLVDTVTVGYISALDRRISQTNGGYTSRYIQTDTAINPGNSGGPLVNLYGQVIGINSSKIADVESEGICFAIPADQALSIVENLLANGRVVGRARLGVTYTAVNSVQAELNHCPVGIYLASIDEESDLYGHAAVGDIITHVNGQAITNSKILLDIIDNASAGDTIRITVYQSQSGSSTDLTVRLLEYVGSSSYKTAPTESESSAPEDHDDGSRQDFLLPNP